MGIKKKSTIKEPPMFPHHEVKWTAESSARLWNYYSSSTAHRSKYFGNRCGREVAHLLSRKIFSKVNTILDYSCGRGDLLAQCAPFFKPRHRIHACDMSTSSIEEASTRLTPISNFVSATVIEDLPSELPSKYFDLVIATEVLEHLNDLELKRTLEDIARIVSTGGYIFLTTPYQEDLESEKTICPDCGCVFHRWQHQRSWTIEEVKSTLRIYGFEIIECKNIQWGPWPLKLYFWLTRVPGNGIYYIGKKIVD